MTALNNNKETSINPMIIMDKAIDMSTRLSGSQFPVSIFPAKIQRIIKEVHECHSFPTDYISAAIYNRENDLYKFSKRNVQKSPFFRCLSSCLRISFKRLLIGV